MLNFFRFPGVRSIEIRSSAAVGGLRNLKRTLVWAVCVLGGVGAVAQTATPPALVSVQTVAVWRPSEGIFYVSLAGKLEALRWGMAGDIPVVADYDGDGRLDIAVWRPSDGTWYLMSKQGTALKSVQWGMKGDVPVPADFDGDKRADFAVWRPSDGTWYVQGSVDGRMWIYQWGQAGDIPLVGRF